jgi:hypothetical protein
MMNLFHQPKKRTNRAKKVNLPRFCVRGGIVATRIFPYN